jgi:hypothetical protein
MESNNKLAAFIAAATPEELDAVAAKGGTTANYLHHLAKQYGKGRCPNVKLALGIVEAIKELRQENRKLPAVRIEDIAALCSVKEGGAEV